MSASKNTPDNRTEVLKLESRISDLKKEMEGIQFQLQEDSRKLDFYRFIADFTFGWELWFEPKGEIKYCSPSCYDLTGFTANQIINSSGIKELLVYESDRVKYTDFVNGALNQELVIQSLEFRILTRTKQLRWCIMNVRGVYDKQGRYLGVRASVQDISRLKNAMGHITELEKGKEFEVRTKQRLQSELDLKDRELVSFLLQLSQKNELISKAINLLEKNKHSSNSTRVLNELKTMLKGGSVLPFDWDMVQQQIEKSHPGFMGRLISKHPAISNNDQKLCAYIRLGLSSKEISGLLNITPKSVEVARVRLRKKLQISSKIRLSNYISQV